MDLTELRERIDSVDAQIVDLYEQRLEICSQIADYKIANGKKVFDRVREQEKLAKVRSMAHNEFNAQGVEELFEQLMAVSRKLQYRLLAEHGTQGKLPFIAVDALDTKDARVVFQGAEGAYSHIATRAFFGENVNAFHVDTFRDAMTAIDEGSADFAVLPIENSTAGIVSEVYELLAEFDNYIVAEKPIRIEHCLLGVPGSTTEEIRSVYAHFQSLMQCSKFLADRNVTQNSMPNNAFAARKVAQDGDKTQAAIASELAGKIYGLDILERGINQSSKNTTRFIIVTNQKIFLKEASRVSICFELPHESGSLYHMLSHFIYNDLSLTRIESRPIPDRSWEYRFFAEFEGNLSDVSVKNAIRGLRDEARMLKILGNY